MNMNRRELLRSTVAGVGAVGALQQGFSPAVAKPARGRYDPWERVPLGKTGLTVSRVGFGTGMKGWMRKSNQTRLGKKVFERLLRESYERGLQLFDMADLYGTHRFLPGAMKGVPRDRYTILTKIWFRPRGIPEKERPDADVVVKRFLKELQTDYIDILLIHCQTDPDWPDKMKKQMEIYSDLKKQGLIRACGVSCHSLPALKAAARSSWVDSINTRINAYGVKMDDTPEKVIPVLQEARRNGTGIIGMKLVGEGQFRDDPGKRDASIRTALLDAGVSAMVVGFEKSAEIDDFAERVRTVPRAAEKG